MTAGFEEPGQPGQHNTRDKPQPPFFKQPLRSPGQPDVMIGIGSLPDRSQPGPRVIEKYTSPTEIVGTNAYGAISGRRNEQTSKLDGARKTPSRSAKRGRHYKSLPPPPPKQHKSKKGKIVREQESRLNQTTWFQNVEDFLECVLGWQAPKKQTPGNVKKSGMVDDKQQTMEAFYILCDVLVRHAISPLEPRSGETCIQAVVREVNHEIEIHLRGRSSTVLPKYSLMAEAESLDGPRCTITSDHEQCLLDNTSACIRCRKKRHSEAYKDNRRRLPARRGRTSSAASTLNTH